MDKTTIQIDLIGNAQITTQEAVRILSDYFFYKDKIPAPDGSEINNPETRRQFIKRTISEQFSGIIAEKKRADAMRELVIPNVTIE